MAAESVFNSKLDETDLQHQRAIIDGAGVNGGRVNNMRLDIFLEGSN